MQTLTLNASKQPIGRVATQAAVFLMGKHHPSFEKYTKEPYRVVIIQSDALIMTGKKLLQKKYYRHSGYLGNLRTFSAEWMKKHDSREIVRHAVLGMLPKNKLRKELMKRLVIYKDVGSKV